MTQEGQISPPPVMWAQRSHILYVTICLEDCKDPTLEIKPDKVYFKGIGGTEKKMHEVTINLYAEIDVEKSIQSRKDRNIELVLVKKKEGPFWPRLTKENQKFHWLKSDFNKWVDEDDSGEEGADGQSDLSQMMRQLAQGGLEMDEKPDFNDLDMEDESDRPDSDDDEMPELE